MTALNLSDLAAILRSGGPPRLVLHATLRPIAGLTRFQPAGFPEVGPVIYKAPDDRGAFKHVGIVDSPASMANHLEALCVRAPHDPRPVDELALLPHLRRLDAQGEVVTTSLTEPHRLGSDAFLDAQRPGQTRTLRDELRERCGLGKDDTPLPARFWEIFRFIFEHDPNSLVHGILIPKNPSVKIARVLTAHLEAIGAERIGYAGVKFDQQELTRSGQPIFAVEEQTASEIRATFLIDLGLVRSFGDGQRGLRPVEQELLLRLSLWKIGRLLREPYRYRSRCVLECLKLTLEGGDAIDPARLAGDLGPALAACGFKAGSTVIDVTKPEAPKAAAPATGAGGKKPRGKKNES